MNPVPTSPLADDLATASPEPVTPLYPERRFYQVLNSKYKAIRPVSPVVRGSYHEQCIVI